MAIEDESKKKYIVKLIAKLYIENNLDDSELLWLLNNIDKDGKEYLFSLSQDTRNKHYGKSVYMRGLIEFTNYCKRECRYCGINRYNKNITRYRLTKKDIIETCLKGRNMGFNTFVLQGGEDMFFSDKMICDIVSSIKKSISDCAVTLSIGERSYDSYKAFKEAGADRFLLRHETTNEDLYRWLHPFSHLGSRLKCLSNLKKLGFQTGTGFMVGLPWYTNKDYVKDLRFMKNLQPEMVGIGPFIPHHDTNLNYYKAGDIETTVLMLSLIRLLLPKVLLPATTALGTISTEGRKRGLDVGANVIMPNLTPKVYRGDYSLYDNKKSTGSESVEALKMIKRELEDYGYIADMSRGDSKMCKKHKVK